MKKILKGVLIIILIIFFLVSGYLLTKKFTTQEKQLVKYIFKYYSTPTEKQNIAHQTTNAVLLHPKTNTLYHVTKNPKSSNDKIQLITLNLNSYQDGQEDLEGCNVIETIETKPDKRGIFQRIRLIRTKFTYPLIRTEEILEHKLNSQDKLISQKSFIGDHILIKIKPHISKTELNAIATKNDGYIIKKTREPNVYIIGFKNASINTVPHAITVFAASPAILYAKTDCITY